MKVLHENTELHYEDSGKGEAFVLLHGFLESLDIWEPFVPDFSQGQRLIRIDLPGHGGSGCIAEVHSMELMAHAVYAVLSELDVKQAHLLGHSMGGYVALAFLELYPGMVREITLVNSTPEADSQKKKEIRTRSAEMVKRNKNAYISMAISNLVAREGSRAQDFSILTLKKKAYRMTEQGVISALLGMKIRKDRKEVFKGFTGTKKIISGEKDPLLNIHRLESVAKETAALFFILPGGHLSYLEKEEEFRNLCISSII